VLGKYLGADGNLWIALPDNASLDLFIAAPPRHYDAWASPTKYKLRISARGNGINYDDLSVTNPEFCVGQNLTFVANWDYDPGAVDTVYHWHLPDKYVNQQTNYSATCMTYVRNDNLLTNTSVQCWYVNQPGGACSVRETLHFANGQAVNIAAAGSFTVYRPQKNNENMNQDLVTPNLYPNIPSPPLYATNVNGMLQLGDPQGGYARFWATYYSSYPGEFQEAQIVQSYRKAGNDDPVDSGSLWWNDHAYDKGGSLSTVSSEGGIAFAMQTDQYPGWQLKAPQTVVYDVFKTYFQFKPAGDGIWVTMGRVNWSWAATSTYTGGLWNPPSGTTVSDPQYHDDDSFPLWDGEHP